MACEQGRLAEFKGKGLDQISINPRGKKVSIVMAKMFVTRMTFNLHVLNWMPFAFVCCLEDKSEVMEESSG